MPVIRARLLIVRRDILLVDGSERGRRRRRSVPLLGRLARARAELPPPLGICEQALERAPQRMHVARLDEDAR